MGKEDLLALGLDADTVEKIIVMHGKATEKLKGEVATLKETVDSTNEQLTSMTGQYSELKEKVQEVDSVKKTYEEKLQNYTKELETYKTQDILNKHNVSKDFRDYVSFKVKEQVSDDKDFETVLSEFIESNPQFTGKKEVKQTSPSFEGKPDPMDDRQKVNEAFKALAKK